MNSRKVLRGFLIFAGLYLMVEAILHLFNVRLLSINQTWPTSAMVFGNLMDQYFSVFAFMVALTALVIQKDVKRYRLLISISAVWAIWFGSVLVFLALSKDYSIIFKSMPSVYVWIPFYNYYLIFEATLLFLYSGVVFWWRKGTKNEK